MLCRFAFVLAALLSLPSRAAAGDVLVFAAVSLQEALTDAVDVYAARGNPKPLLSFAASSALAKQIEHGAPAGLFLSADAQWMDYLDSRRLLAAGTRTDFLGNELVLVAPASRPFPLEIAPGFALAAVLGREKLALADPDAVPAGRYAKAALSSLGVWSQVEGSVVRAADVRRALTLVERDEVRAGIVYRTDARGSGKVAVVGAFPPPSHPPIVYPLAVVAAHDTPAARALRDFLLSPAGRDVFVRHGFSVK